MSYSMPGSGASRALLLALLAALCGCAEDLDSAILGGELQGLSAEDRYIVVMREQAPRRAIEAPGVTVLAELGPQRAVAARVRPDALPALRRNPHVELIEVDRRRYLLSQTVPYGIPMVEADLVHDGSAANRTVCVVDTGYYLAHEDLPSATVTGSNDPGTGDWWEDGRGHGTHVAGIIAALDNDIGVLGVLPGGNVGLHIVKTFDDFGDWAYSSDLVAAVNTCVDNGSHVINLSLGGPHQTLLERNAFQSIFDQGVLSVAGAGNSGSTDHMYPASYSSVISVAAIDENRNHAPFSQRNDQVELSAPGVQVLSTVPPGVSTEASVTSGGQEYPALEMRGSPMGVVTAPLHDCGLALSPCSGAAGQICLIRRGDITFAEKVQNCEAGGGVGAVIHNNVSGPLRGTLGGAQTSIPSAGITQADGQALLARIGEPATLSIDHGKYAAWDGTSMATPYVAGVAALIWSHDPSWTNVEIREALTETAEDLGTAGRNDLFGHGLVRARAALDYLEPTTDVEPPVFSPDPSVVYTSEQQVTMTSATQGASIRYTLDGSEPTEASTLHASPITLGTRSETTIRARAYLDDRPPSEVVSAHYRITGTVDEPFITPSTGTYREPQEVEITTATPDAVIHYTLDGSEPTQGAAEYGSPIQVPEDTSVTVRARAFRPDWEPSPVTSATIQVTGSVSSPVLSPEPGIHARPMSVTISVGSPGATIRFTRDGSDPTAESEPYVEPIALEEDSETTVCARAFLEDWTPSEPSCGTYTVTGRVAAPAFSPPPGLFPGAVSVSISTATSGAVIRYTTDGSEPDVSAPVYDEPIEVAEGSAVTIRARAYREHWRESLLSEGYFQGFGGITIVDEEGEPLSKAEVPSGGDLFFRVSGGSGEHEISVAIAEGLQAGEVEASEPGYLYRAAVEGAFAGENEIVVTDPVTGGVARLGVRVPLRVQVNPSVLAHGRAVADVVVRGARPGVTPSYVLLDTDGRPLPSAGQVVDKKPSADAFANGNPATASLEVAHTTEPVVFRLRATSGAAEGLSGTLRIEPDTSSSTVSCGCSSAGGKGPSALLPALALMGLLAAARASRSRRRCPS